MSEINNLPEGSPAGRQKGSSLGDRVYHLLFSRISSGDYSAEQRLPSENELAAEFDVSRPIVRDALERLRKEGLIYSRQGAGSFVRTRTDQRTLGFSPVETIADIQRCYEFRLTIEPDSAFYAARRRNSEMMARIGAALDLLSDATRQQRHREDADFAFHLAVSEATNNHYYWSSMQALKNHIAVGMKLHGLSLMGPSPGGLQHVLDEHRAIFEAIRDGDADTARAAMRKHLEGSRDRLFEGKVLDLSL